MTDINVPYTQPNAPQAVNPAPFLEAYLNRPNANQVATQQLGNSIDAFSQYQLQKQQRQLEALKSISELYGQGGPGAVQQYAPTINRVAGTDIIQGQPQGQMGMPAPQMQGQSQELAAMPASMLSQVANSPQGNQIAPGKKPFPQGTKDPAGTLPMAQSAPSEHIQNSLSLGHPDFTGHMARIQQLQNQMAGFQNQGKYGQTQTGQLAQNIAAEKSALDAEQAPLEYAGKQQALTNAQQQIPMEIKKTIAGEQSKLAPEMTKNDTLQSMYKGLETALAKSKATPTTGLKGKLYSASSGWMGGAEGRAGDQLTRAAIPLGTALNTELSKRFNEGEVKALVSSLMPSAFDAPQRRIDKMASLKNIIDTMKQGNDNALQRVASTMLGKPLTPVSSQGQQQPIPDGRVTVKSPSGQIGHIPASQLQTALAEGYTQQ